MIVGSRPVYVIIDNVSSFPFVHSRTLMLTDKLKTIPRDLNVGKILLMMYIFLQGLQFNTYFKVQGVWVVTLLLINLL